MMARHRAGTTAATGQGVDQATGVLLFAAATVVPVAATVHQIRVTLQGMEPTVWRRLHVPSDVPLSGLHAVIQVAMGWEDFHLYEFSAN